MKPTRLALHAWKINQRRQHPSARSSQSSHSSCLWLPEPTESKQRRPALQECQRAPPTPWHSSPALTIHWWCTYWTHVVFSVYNKGILRQRHFCHVLQPQVEVSECNWMMTSERRSHLYHYQHLFYLSQLQVFWCIWFSHWWRFLKTFNLLLFHFLSAKSFLCPK